MEGFTVCYDFLEAVCFTIEKICYKTYTLANLDLAKKNGEAVHILFIY